jgi:phosphoglycerate dehydrogenase-like enzyme
VKIRVKDCAACEPVQHLAVLGDEQASASAVVVEAGPIAVLPRPQKVFVDAVESGGGVVATLSAETRGLIWLSYSQTAELGEVLAANPQISWVQLPFAGVDAYSAVLAEHATPRRVFTSAKGAFAQPVAEHALALTLAILRFLPRRARATSWDGVPRGISLYGKNVTIVGAGGIARELIRLLAPFGVKISVVRRSSEMVPGAQRTVSSAQLHSVLPDADVVVIAAALTAQTRHLMGSVEFAMMKPTVAVVNIARGPLIDSDALVAALEAGAILGAAADVTFPEPLPDGDPLWSAPNMLITPHMADTPEMTAPLLAERIRHNVAAFLAGSRFVGVVDTSSGY